MRRGGKQVTVLVAVERSAALKETLAVGRPWQGKQSPWWRF